MVARCPLKKNMRLYMRLYFFLSLGPLRVSSVSRLARVVLFNSAIIDAPNHYISSCHNGLLCGVGIRAWRAGPGRNRGASSTHGFRSICHVVSSPPGAQQPRKRTDTTAACNALSLKGGWEDTKTEHTLEHTTAHETKNVRRLNETFYVGSCEFRSVKKKSAFVTPATPRTPAGGRA